MDPKIAEAIEKVVLDAGQREPLARRLIAWFNALASGDEDINDRQSAERRLELLYGEVQLTGPSANTETEANTEFPADFEGPD